MHKSIIKAVLLQIHSVAGITLSLLLAVIGLTGATMSFEDEIQAALNAGMAHVEPQATPRLTPDQLIARLRQAGDFGRVSSMTLSNDPSASVRIRFAGNKNSSQPSSFFVDPYDARVIGSPIGEEFFATVRKLHRWLLLPGDANGYGRQITGIMALGLIAMLITGLALRWPYRAGSIKVWLKPNLALRGRGFFRSLHSVAGTWVLPIYLIMPLTGLWYSFDWYKNGATWLLARPVVSHAATQIKTARGDSAAAEKSEIKTVTSPLALDQVWSTFLKDQGQRFAIMQMMLPAGDGTIVRIRSWEQGAAGGVRDEFKIDAVTGRMTSSELYADKTTGEKILARVLDIHRGSILGWPGKLLFMLAASLMPLFTVTGLLLYFSRRRHRHLARMAQNSGMATLGTK